MDRAKTVLKYGIYLFIAAWMFVLGVMVGRGMAPVSFDTENFQARLQSIAREFGSEEQPSERVDLRFYEVLDDPVPEAVERENKGEILPAKEAKQPMPEKGEPEKPGPEKKDGPVPVKVSRKAATFKGRTADRHAPVPAKAKAAESDSTATASKKNDPLPVKSRSVAFAKPKSPHQTASVKAAETPGPPKAGAAPKTVGGAGPYTVQVAAYKAFSDAVAHSAVLEKKGFASFRVKGKTDGKIWYRVRTGRFDTHARATAYLDQLKRAGINGMVIKTDSSGP